MRFNLLLYIYHCLTFVCVINVETSSTQSKDKKRTHIGITECFSKLILGKLDRQTNRLTDKQTD